VESSSIEKLVDQGISSLGSGRCGGPQLGAFRANRAQALTQSCPGPGLHLLVAHGGLTSGRRQILEPRVGFLDQKQLVGLTLRCHPGRSVGPGPDGLRPDRRLRPVQFGQRGHFRRTHGPAHASWRRHRKRCRRTVQRRRTQIACKTPTAARFTTIEDPPEDTNGSGIPVIGAFPIDMSTLMKICTRNTKAMPPATVAVYASVA